ncbi:MULTISPECIES: 4'-phosphopantetheinyl transferase superfamily protein [Rahnella]|uniref:4'-phosphopantetheinyl transferase superfamily protein n=1 Tax=Rahnella perminowiae TaxID=2816244 RepID=A0ABS6KYX5_9GAMM|nr:MULTISPECIES: 4'-phosphopantetheinyl transferase superfamily protein [Rahnella]MBU9834529.1 4'-phosphopantetheinyl transferase superfamily protein [Rahnella perminowiae]
MNRAQLITASLDDNFSLSRVPAQWLMKSEGMNPARRQQWCAGRALLAEALSVFSGCDNLPAMQISAQGKPYFADASLPHFSLSHSKHHLQLLLCPAGEDGGDVEQIRPRRRYLDVARAAFSDIECQWLVEQADPQTAFWQLWCLREAWLKQQGGSVWQMGRIRLEPGHQRFTAESSADCRLWFAADGNVMRALALPAGVSEVEEYKVDAASGGFLRQVSLPWARFSPS